MMIIIILMFDKCVSDIDECKSDNAGCDDICMNTPGSYSCACRLVITHA